MQSITNFLNEHKKGLIALIIVCIIILLIVVSYKKVLDYLSPSEKTSIYGDRCDAVIDTPIKKETLDSLKEFINSQENISVTKLEKKCKLLDIVINLDQDIDFEIVKELGTNILNNLPEEVVKNYDIQLFVTSSNEEDTNYPKIGTHHKLINDEMSSEFVW